MHRTHRTRTAAALAAGAALVLVDAGAAAAALPDTTPPTLTAPAQASFVRGASISPIAVTGETFPGTSWVAMEARFRATDPSGICGYSTRQVYSGSEPEPWTAWSSATRLVDRYVNDYDGRDGGGSLRAVGHEVRAKDCAGNIATRFVSFGMNVHQEDGSSYGGGTVPARYTPAWADSVCVCWSGGAAKKTSTAGATARYTFTVDRPTPIGLVMERAADRGAVQVLVDGVRKATVDTYRAAKQHRAVVWTGTLPKGTHTLAVRNVGTPGRARVDVDAVLLASPFSAP